MEGRRARVERRLRERGRPAWATVTGAEASGAGLCRLALRVAPGEGPPFDAYAILEWADADAPPVGGTVEVLHGPDGGGRVLALGTPSRAPEPPAEPAPPAPAPDIGAVIRAVVRAAGDGSLAQGMPIVLTDDEDDRPPPRL